MSFESIVSHLSRYFGRLCNFDSLAFANRSLDAGKTYIANSRSTFLFVNIKYFDTCLVVSFRSSNLTPYE